MDLCVINQGASKIDNEANVRLLWVSLLIGESGYSSGVVSDFLYLILRWDLLPEKVKYILTIKHFEVNPNVDDNYIAEVKRMYETVQQGRKLKNKPRELIVAWQRCEKIMKLMYDSTKQWYENTALSNHIEELLNFLDYDDVERKKPFRIFPLDSDLSSRYAEQTIISVTHLLSEKDGIPVFDGNVKDFFNGYDINEKGTIPDSTAYVYDFLCEFPAPETLNSSQASMVRSDMSKVFWKFFKNCETLNEQLNKIEFGKNNMETFINLYKEKTNGVQQKMQQAIDECVILKTLKTDNPSIERYKIFIGIGSFNTVFKYYKAAEILQDDIIMYAIEEMEKKTSSKNARLFLFISK